MGLFKSLFQFTAGSGLAAGAAWYQYTRKTHFVPFDTNSPDFQSTIARKYNPQLNSPSCIDHAVRTVPLSSLKTTDQETLTREFCRGIWSGPGFEIQRKVLERRWRAHPGRNDMLWEKNELRDSNYDVGTKIADHFEVVERTPEKVTVRCGDSPTITEPRPSDGIFSIEVSKDDQNATFHLKSIFFDSTPGGGAKMPSHIEFLHREYDKLWMETSVRKLLK